MVNRNEAPEKIAALQRQIRQLQIIGLLLLIFTAVEFFARDVRPVEAQARPGVLRVRGLVIEDAEGRDRILIGSPVPASARRIRTDESRVRQLWAKRYPNPDRYMEFYKGYNHATNGILILDENGFDRIALGDPVPDPNIGKRVGPSTGIVINDESGSERSGYGLLKLGENYRVVLGLDSAQGREGLTLALIDRGRTGITVQDSQGTVWVGSAPSGDPVTGLAKAFHGLLTTGTDETRTTSGLPIEK